MSIFKTRTMALKLALASFGFLLIGSPAIAGSGKIRCDSLFDLNRRDIKKKGWKSSAKEDSYQKDLADEILSYAVELFNSINLNAGGVSNNAPVVDSFSLLQQVANQASVLDFKKQEILNKLTGFAGRISPSRSKENQKKATTILLVIVRGGTYLCEAVDYRIFRRLIEIAGLSQSQAENLTRQYVKKRLPYQSDVGIETIIKDAIFKAQENEATENAEPFFTLKMVAPRRLLIISNNLSFEMVKQKTNFSWSNAPVLILPFQEFGIKIYDLALPSLSPFDKAEYAFKIDGKKYSLQLKSTPPRLNPLWEKRKAPKLKEMWSDGKLSGLILIGDSLQEEGYWLEGEYNEYFRSQGFQFQPAKIVELETGALELIKNGSIDYVITENSGGRTSDWVRLIQGERTTSQGKETIYIGSSIRTNEIPINEKNLGIRILKHYILEPAEILPEIMFERKKNGINTELIYISSECNSAECLSVIANRTSSPNLTYIAAYTIAETFSNTDDSTLKHLLHGLRTGQSYSEIWKQMRRIESKARHEAMISNPREWREDYEKENLYMLPPYREAAIGTHSNSINEISAVFMDEKSNVIPLTVETF